MLLARTNTCGGHRSAIIMWERTTGPLPISPNAQWQVCKSTRTTREQKSNFKWEYEQMSYATETRIHKPGFKETLFLVRLFIKRLIVHRVDMTASLNEHESGLRRFIYESTEQKPRLRADRDTVLLCERGACVCVQPQPVPALFFEPKIVRCPHCVQTVMTRVTNHFD